MKISKFFPIVWVLAAVWMLARYFGPGQVAVSQGDLGSDYSGQTYSPPQTHLEQALIDKSVNFAATPEGFVVKTYTLSTDSADFQISSLGGVVTGMQCKNTGFASRGKGCLTADKDKPMGLGAVLFANESPVDFSTVEEITVDGMPGLRMIGESSIARVEKTFLTTNQPYQLRVTLKGELKDSASLVDNRNVRLVLFAPSVPGLSADPREALFWSDKTKSVLQPGHKESLDLCIKLPSVIGLEDRYFCAMAKFADFGKAAPRAYTVEVDKNLLGLVELDTRGRLECSFDLFVGPKDTKALAAFGPAVDKIVNFGWMDPLAKLLLWFLVLLGKLLGNLGLAIILLAVLVRLLFLPLSIFIRRRMYGFTKFEKGIAPQLAQIKKTWAADFGRQQTEIGALYKKYGFNQMLGLLRIVPKLPDILFYFLVYRLVMVSQIFSGASAFLWISDLSMADPYKILPVSLGLMSMIAAFGDPATKPKFDAFKIMAPLFVVYMISGFPAGAILFSVVVLFMNQLEDLVFSKIYV